MFVLLVTALDLAHNSNVQDAFVIAVEQQARERLERLSALKRIKPVDMTKLSQQVSTRVMYYLLVFGVGMNRQIGTRGGTAEVPTSVFCTFQKRPQRLKL
jgi:hypothetical protein